MAFRLETGSHGVIIRGRFPNRLPHLPQQRRTVFDAIQTETLPLPSPEKVALLNKLLATRWFPLFTEFPSQEHTEFLKSNLQRLRNSLTPFANSDEPQKDAFELWQDQLAQTVQMPGPSKITQGYMLSKLGEKITISAFNAVELRLGERAKATNERELRLQIGENLATLVNNLIKLFYDSHPNATMKKPFEEFVRLHRNGASEINIDPGGIFYLHSIIQAGGKTFLGCLHENDAEMTINSLNAGCQHYPLAQTEDQAESDIFVFDGTESAEPSAVPQTAPDIA